MSDIRYYLQQEPPSVRRYSDTESERYETASKKWLRDCAPESACLATKDKLATEAEAIFFIRTRL